jgi:hypothetical protein
MKPAGTLLMVALLGTWAATPSLAQQDKGGAANAAGDTAGPSVPKGDAGNGSGSGNGAPKESDRPADTAGPPAPSNVNGVTKKGTGDVANDGNHKGTALPALAGKTGAEHIDLIHPDDGYANLRRRAARKALAAGIAANKKLTPSFVPANIAAHDQGTKPPTSPVTHNAIGAVVANGHPLDRKGLVLTPPHQISGTNSVGVATSNPLPPPVHVHTATTLPTTGVNGTAIAHTSAPPGSVGGPAKLNTGGVNGTSLKPRF